ncbi:MAG: chaperonin GroEL [Anaerolineales bacterium]
MPKPDLLLGEECRVSMLRGFDSLGRLLSLTLGPIGGHIANQREGTNETELLNDAATIARRVLQLPDRSENVGAMMMRHIVWHMRQAVGDGSATTAVIAQATAREMQKLIAAGANAMILRRGIEKGLAVALAELERLAMPLQGEERIAAVATAAIGDAEIGKLLGELYDVLGEDAAIVIEPYIATYHDRVYRDGARFRGGYLSPYLITDQDRHVAVLDDPYIVVGEIRFESTEAIQQILEQVIKAGGKSVFFAVRGMSDKALSMLVANNEQGIITSCAASLKPVGEERSGTFQNIALLTGATFLDDKHGWSEMDVRLSDMGRASRVTVTRETFTIAGGRGDRTLCEERRRELRARLRASHDPEERATLRTLLKHFSGGIGELRIGALTSQERKALTERAEEAMHAVDAAMEAGIVPGGGAAYLACIPALETVEAEGDERLGVQVLARVLEEPMRRIAGNAGLHPPLVIAESERLGVGYGYDVMNERYGPMIELGIADAAVVAKRALQQGVSGAVMLLTTDALVLHRKPQESFTP